MWPSRCLASAPLPLERPFIQDLPSDFSALMVTGCSSVPAKLQRSPIIPNADTLIQCGWGCRKQNHDQQTFGNILSRTIEQDCHTCFVSLQLAVIMQLTRRGRSWWLRLAFELRLCLWDCLRRLLLPCIWHMLSDWKERDRNHGMLTEAYGAVLMHESHEKSMHTYKLRR